MSEEQQINITQDAPTGQATANGAPAPQAEQAPNQADLQARVAQLEKEAAELRDSWLRAAADYKNYKRRAEQERAELIRNASAGLLLKLLPVADDLERAIASVPETVKATQWYEGVRMIAQKLQTILESEGVMPIDAVGQEFDPTLHEAVLYEETDDGQEGKVVAELQKGYRLRDRVLRPTMVKVGKG